MATRLRARKKMDWEGDEGDDRMGPLVSETEREGV